MPETLKRLKKKAAIALNDGAFAELESYAKQILQLDDTYADAWFFLSLSATERRKVSVAIELVDSALRRSGRNTDMLPIRHVFTRWLDKKKPLSRLPIMP